MTDTDPTKAFRTAAPAAASRVDTSVEAYETALADLAALQHDIGVYTAEKLIWHAVSTKKNPDLKSQAAWEAASRRISQRLDRIGAVLRANQPQPNFDTAVDWLVNRQQIEDSDAFFAICEGVISEEEADRLSYQEIRERRVQAGQVAA